jgi:4-hydroxy-tetrahydrodipicolinate synthase
MLRGVFPVLSTPFFSDGRCDARSLFRLVAQVAKARAPGFVYPAIASEFATLSVIERQEMVQTALAAAAEYGLQAIIGISSDSAQLSATLAQQALGGRAAGVMLMAPQETGADPTKIVQFINVATAGLNGCPVILQNASPPLGSSLPVTVVLEVLKAVPSIRYVKEENLPCGQRMTALLAGAPASLLGVMGGAGGRFVVEEYLRGACGSMPSCELIEAHVAMWNLFQIGNVAGARAILSRLMPMLNLGSVFRQSSVKRVLAKRGLIESAYFRDNNPTLDPLDCSEIDAIMADLGDLMKVFTDKAEEQDVI